MLEGLGSGDSTMAYLRLHVEDPMESAFDPIPFPGRAQTRVGRIGLTRPTPTCDSIADAERALARVEERFGKLRGLIEEASEPDDRPRAA